MRLDELESIYETEYQSLLRLAKQQLRKTRVARSEQAEDIVQSVFTYLLDHAETEEPRYLTLENGPGFPTYLKNAVLSRIYNLVRHEVEVRNPIHADLRYVAPKEVTPDRSLFQIVIEVIEGFENPQVREMLRLIYLEDWARGEAVYHTRLNPSSARGYIAQMRERVRLALIENGEVK